MSVMQAEQHVTSASDRLVDQLADKIGGLGVELADVAGNVQDVASRVSGQSDRFGHLQKTAETMVSANHGIASASQAVLTATTAAVDEIAQSRTAVETAVRHIAELVEAVGRIEHRLASVGTALAGSGQSLRIDRGDRAANQSAGAERDHRSGARRIRRARLCRRRQRSEEPRRGDPTGDAIDRRHGSRPRWPGHEPDRREQRRLGAGQGRRRRRDQIQSIDRAHAGRLYLGRPRDRWRSPSQPHPISSIATA